MPVSHTQPAALPAASTLAPQVPLTRRSHFTCVFGLDTAVSNPCENRIQYLPPELPAPCTAHSLLPQAPIDVGSGLQLELGPFEHPIVSPLRDMDSGQFGVKICHSDFFF